MRHRFQAPRTALLALALATAAGLNALAASGEHDHGTHDHAAAQSGHDHSQHSHSRVMKVGAFWEAGLDVTDWRKAARACPAHPQIVSNKADSNCPITPGLKIDRPTTAPKGAARRIGLVLLPATGHRHPLSDARIRLVSPGKPPMPLQQKDGYYWVDLPATFHGPATLDVRQGGRSHQQRLDDLTP